MHVQGIPEMNRRLAGNAGLTNVIRNPLRHDLPVASDLRRHPRPFPGLKICSAHSGGCLPCYRARPDYGCNRFPDAKIKQHPTEYLQ